MDEAHALKDKNSYRWKNLMSVAKNANQRLMLTGTPLQNDLHVRLLMVSFFIICLLPFILDPLCWLVLFSISGYSKCYVEGGANIFFEVVITVENILRPFI